MKAQFYCADDGTADESAEKLALAAGILAI
jgi:hypothetical protein